MGKKILVVDDEEDIRTSTQMILVNLGYDVDLASDGPPALKLLKSKKYDLIILDMLMPEMSGIKIAKKIRSISKLKGQKIAFMTVVVPSEAGQFEISDLKPVDYFRKPIDLKDFSKRIKKILG
jgi:DNA-binding response OmpR family regulator